MGDAGTTDAAHELTVAETNVADVVPASEKGGEREVRSAHGCEKNANTHVLARRTLTYHRCSYVF